MVNFISLFVSGFIGVLGIIIFGIGHSWRKESTQWKCNWSIPLMSFGVFFFSIGFVFVFAEFIFYYIIFINTETYDTVVLNQDQSFQGLFQATLISVTATLGGISSAIVLYSQNKKDSEYLDLQLRVNKLEEEIKILKD
ncbi:hypothetical protein [Methanolapillus africanus]